MATLVNLGTATDDFDLPESGPTNTRTRVFPALLPTDPPTTYYVGELDLSATAEGPYARSRVIAENYPYIWTGGNPPAIGQGLSNTDIFNTYGYVGSSGDIDIDSTALLGYRNMWFPAASGNYLSVPDAANLDITTSIEIVFRVAMQEPLNKLGNQRIVAKSGSARGYEVFLGYDTQAGTLNFTPDGTQIATSDRKIPALPGRPYWYKVTYNSTTDQTKFYWADDDSSVPSSWNQLGSTITTATNVMPINAETLKIGTYNGTSDLFAGRLYNLIIRDADVAGTTVLNIDIEDDTMAMVQDVTTSFTATTGQTVTLTKSGSVPNTVRIIPSNDTTYNTFSNGQLYGQLTSVDELTTLENQIQIVWVSMTFNSTYATTRRIIHPIIQCYAPGPGGGPFQSNSWGLYLDTVNNVIMFSARIGTVTSALEVFATTYGVSAPNSTGSTYVYGAVINERGGDTYIYPFRYNNNTNVIDDPVSISSLGVELPTSTGLIGATPSITLWKGVIGATVNTAGIAVIDNVTGDTDSVRLGTNADVRLDDLIERHMRTIVFDEDPSYELGHYWRASTDGTMEGAPKIVEEGDLLISLETGNIPTWGQIKLDDPSRRKALLKGRGSTFSPAADSISVAPDEDIFVWWVMALHGTGNPDFSVDEYPIMANDTVNNGYIYANIWLSGGTGEWNLYLEMEDDDDNFGWTEAYESDGTLPTLFPNGHSSPTLFALALDKTRDAFIGWLYNPDLGLHTFENADSSAATTSFTSSTMNLDILSFFGPEISDTGPDALYWGGGWLQGVGVVPDEDGMARLWEQTVYGYASP